MYERLNILVKTGMLTPDEAEQELIDHGYIDQMGAPMKCMYCDHDEFEQITTYWEEYLECEFEVRCKNCGRVVGYWAYGYYEPIFK